MIIIIIAHNYKNIRARGFATAILGVIKRVIKTQL